MASQGCNLVFADNSPLASKRLSILADALDAVKSRNADAVSCRIITHLPWCHVSSVNCAIRVLAKAQDAYAPGIGAETRIVDNPDTLFDAIIAEEREKYDLCGRCAFSLNCIGLPAPRTDINDDSMFEQIPVSYDEFKSWDFYEAF